MLKSLSRIAPFLIVTLLSIAGVESFYAAVEYFFFDVSEKGEKQTEAQVVQRKSPEEPRKHASYDVIMERNLFQSYTGEEAGDRGQADNPLAELEATSLELVLMGTITGNGEANRAIILEKRTNEQEIYNQGDTVQGAEIKKILRGKVVLAYQGKDEILDMSEAAGLRRSSAARPTVPGVSAAAGGQMDAMDQAAMEEAAEAVMKQEIRRPAAIQPRRRVVPTKLQRQEPFPPAPPPEEIE